MLSIAFGQSKYYVDNLAENTKRGLRQKVRRGECPGRVPLGYINDVRAKTIVVDKRRSPIVVSAFQLYAKGDSRLQDIANFLASKNIRTDGGLPLKKDQIAKMLTNPFYYGHFRYSGEVYEGKHKAIVSKKLFDEVQTVFERRRHKRTTKQNTPKPLCGLLHCGSCNMMITGENQVKRQKNGNIHYYTYYHCTKKRKGVKCPESHIRQEALDKQLSVMLNEYAMPTAWASQLETMLAKDETKTSQSSSVFVANAQTKIVSLQSKLQRLLDGYLDQDIEREIYVQKKSMLMFEKKSLEEQSSKLTLASSAWVEPMRKWIETAVSICKTTESNDLLAKKSLCLEIFGSNLLLKNKKAQPLAAQEISPSSENIWLLLRKTKEKIARMGDNSEKSFSMVRVKRL